MYMVVLPFKEMAVDPVSEHLTSLQTSYEQADKQKDMERLRLKKSQLEQDDLTFLQKFYPEKLHSSSFVYNLTQYAAQNGITIKGLQYTVVDDQLNSQGKKLLVELIIQARYESFVAWLVKLEKSNTLIDVQSVTANKRNPNDEFITFGVKLYTYGAKVD